jgi:valyl-tRNA synthetase
MVKPRLYGEKNASRKAAQHALRSVLTDAIKLLHPFTPFITEDLFAALNANEKSIMLSNLPLCNEALNDPAAEKAIERVKEAVRGIRAVRTEKQVPPSQKISVEIIPSGDANVFEGNKAAIALLSGAKEVLFVETPPANAISIVVSGATIYLPLDSLIDTEKERARLSKEKKKLTDEISRIDAKLANQGFISKAPEKLIFAEREKRENFSAMLVKIESEISAL